MLPLEPADMTSYVAFTSISPYLILSLLLPLIPCIAIESVLCTLYGVHISKLYNTLQLSRVKNNIPSAQPRLPRDLIVWIW